MSQRATWGEIKDLVGQPVGLSGDNPMLLPLANEGVKTAWSWGDWPGKNQRYKIRVLGDREGNRYISWPRQIETIEKVNVCGVPVGVRNQYFEFIENAIGPIEQQRRWPWKGWGGISLLGDRGEFPTNEELIPGEKRLRIHTERIEEKGRVLLLGYDDNGNWIRTYNGECWQDGEYLSLSAAPATTVNYFSAIAGVQFDSSPRNGNAYLYSVDADNQERQLATYDYAVTTPVFRRSVLSGLRREYDGAACECVTVLAKMRFMPVMFDTDYPQISDVATLKVILQYIYKRDAGKLDEAEEFKQEALTLLNDILKQYNGYGARREIAFQNRRVWAPSRNLQ